MSTGQGAQVALLGTCLPASPGWVESLLPTAACCCLGLSVLCSWWRHLLPLARRFPSLLALPYAQPLELCVFQHPRAGHVKSSGASQPCLPMMGPWHGAVIELAHAVTRHTRVGSTLEWGLWAGAAGWAVFAGRAPPCAQGMLHSPV